MFSQYIFHWDIYLLAGVGLIRTRPIPVVDPEIRSFQYDNNIMFSAAFGIRVFVNRWLGIVGEVRNYIYPERLEALTISQQDLPVTNATAGAACDTPGGPVCGSRQDPQTWYGSTVLTDNVMVQVGITVFLPFGVSYRLLK
jgi:outer membrane beta-barrel protein